MFFGEGLSRSQAKIMKHIKRKFQFNVQLPEDVVTLLSKSSTQTPLDLRNVPLPDGYEALLIDEDNKLVAAFHHKIGDVTLLIPEPDPILIHFNSAQSNLRIIEETKGNIVKEYVSEKKYSVAVGQNLYKYMDYTSGFAIFLFAAIETMLNKTVPEDFVFKKDKTKFVEHYDFDQIQRNLTFEVKVKEVLFEITKKKFWEEHTTEWSQIMKLKHFRDTIVHAKRQGKTNTPFSYIFKEALDFNYPSTILAVKDFINFYHPNLVEECDCGQDF
jgi:hypothetical protein